MYHFQLDRTQNRSLCLQFSFVRNPVLSPSHSITRYMNSVLCATSYRQILKVRSGNIGHGHGSYGSWTTKLLLYLNDGRVLSHLLFFVTTFNSCKRKMNSNCVNWTMCKSNHINLSAFCPFLFLIHFFTIFLLKQMPLTAAAIRNVMSSPCYKHNPSFNRITWFATFPDEKIWINIEYKKVVPHFVCVRALFFYWNNDKLKCACVRAMRTSINIKIKSKWHHQAHTTSLNLFSFPFAKSNWIGHKTDR